MRWFHIFNLNTYTTNHQIKMSYHKVHELMSQILIIKNSHICYYITYIFIYTQTDDDSAGRQLFIWVDFTVWHFFVAYILSHLRGNLLNCYEFPIYFQQIYIWIHAVFKLILSYISFLLFFFFWIGSNRMKLQKLNFSWHQTCAISGFMQFHVKYL